MATKQIEYTTLQEKQPDDQHQQENPAQRPGYPPDRQQFTYPPEETSYRSLQQAGDERSAADCTLLPSPQQQSSTYFPLMHQPTLVNDRYVIYSESPATIVCPYCRTTVVSAIRHVPGDQTWLCCFVLCFLGCNLGCCLFPFCNTDCLDVLHSCPNCEREVGVFQRRC